MTTDDWFNRCKQVASDLKAIEPIPAIDAAKQFNFPGVYIFSEESGKIIYVGESQDILRRLERHFGRLRRDGTEMSVESRSTPHRAAHAKGHTWPWDHLRSQYVRAIEVTDPDMRQHVERALIREFRPIGNP